MQFNGIPGSPNRRLFDEIVRGFDALKAMREIPEGAMRVAPGSDAVVWKISPEHCGEL